MSPSLGNSRHFAISAGTVSSGLPELVAEMGLIIEARFCGDAGNRFVRFNEVLPSNFNSLCTHIFSGCAFKELFECFYYLAGLDTSCQRQLLQVEPPDQLFGEKLRRVAQPNGRIRRGGAPGPGEFSSQLKDQTLHSKNRALISL